MRKVYLATREELNNIITGGSVDDGTPVGRVVFDYVLRDGYVKANGATVPHASVNYPRLVAFVQANPDRTLAVNIAAWEANKVLYLYNETDDELTLPDYTGLVMQGADAVSEVQAGLPNITGDTNVETRFFMQTNATTKQKGAVKVISNASENLTAMANGNMYYWQNHYLTVGNIYIDASKSNSIYGASTTVQPHAAGLIPQIRY
jgi:hypothetical protein